MESQINRNHNLHQNLFETTELLVKQHVQLEKSIKEKRRLIKSLKEDLSLKTKQCTQLYHTNAVLLEKQAMLEEEVFSWKDKYLNLEQSLSRSLIISNQTLQSNVTKYNQIEQEDNTQYSDPNQDAPSIESKDEIDSLNRRDTFDRTDSSSDLIMDQNGIYHNPPMTESRTSLRTKLYSNSKHNSITNSNSDLNDKLSSFESNQSKLFTLPIQQKNIHSNQIQIQNYQNNQSQNNQIQCNPTQNQIAQKISHSYKLKSNFSNQKLDTTQNLHNIYTREMDSKNPIERQSSNSSTSILNQNQNENNINHPLSNQNTQTKFGLPKLKSSESFFSDESMLHFLSPMYQDSKRLSQFLYQDASKPMYIPKLHHVGVQCNILSPNKSQTLFQAKPQIQTNSYHIFEPSKTESIFYLHVDQSSLNSRKSKRR